MFRSRWLVFLHDLLWIPTAVFVAFSLRFNLSAIPDIYAASMHVLMFIAVPVQAMVFWYFSLYRGVWRFASIPDLLRIVRAVLVGVLLTFVLMFIWQRLEGLPRSVLILYPLLLMLFLAVPRMLYRWFKDHHLQLERFERKRALVVGAGRAGELLVRELLKEGPYNPVAFLDDAVRRQGQEIHGVRVVGRLDELGEAVERYDIEVVLLAIPSASNRLIRKVFESSQEAGVVCRTLPSVVDLADGRVEVSRLRDIRIDDLLGRDEIRHDLDEVRAFLQQKKVLITGAGGSIGSELCRQVLEYEPAQLVMVDHGEFNLYTIEQELRAHRLADRCHALLGDIRDEERMRWIFEHFQPQVVLNAAAYKHVPLVEENPAEGVKTNIFGTCQLADLAVHYAVEKFIQVSTDKAVNPANVMGATKRAAEIYCQNLDQRVAATAFITTRFGNVLGSAGSVVPLFEQQIRRGGPVTVTHPKITRFFMTIPEAVSLILQASAMGQGGEIFVLDMGEPVRIDDLARQMIRLAGLEPGKDIEIRYTGLRPGEKLYEELFHEGEQCQKTSHPKVMLAASRTADWDTLQALLQELKEDCRLRNIEHLKQGLRRFVPEFQADVASTVPEGDVKSGGHSDH